MSIFRVTIPTQARSIQDIDRFSSVDNRFKVASSAIEAAKRRAGRELGALTGTVINKYYRGQLYDPDGGLFERWGTDGHHNTILYSTR